jgi:hypothetical protein
MFRRGPLKVACIALARRFGNDWSTWSLTKAGTGVNVMSESNDRIDARRHRNMEQIGRALRLPQPADAGRAAGWRGAASEPGRMPGPRLLAEPGGMPGPRLLAEAGGMPGPREASADDTKSQPTTSITGVSFMQRHRNAFLGSGAVAAAIAIAVFFGFGGNGTVAAGTIIQNFKQALSRSLSIQLSDIDLDTVDVHGEILLDRGAADACTRYVEVHVTLRADNPKWNDIPAAIVICDAPGNTWKYTRGNGGSTSWLRPYEARFSDELVNNPGWAAFHQVPLDNFGSMPSSLFFGGRNGPGDGVTYTFSSLQRGVVSNMLRTLLMICDSDQSDHHVDQLITLAGSRDVTEAPGGGTRMTLSGFANLSPLGIEALELPDTAAIMKNFALKLNFDPKRGWFTGSDSKHPDEFWQYGITLADKEGKYGIPCDSIDEAAAYLREHASDVKIDKSSDSVWTVSCIGYPAELNTEALDWMREFEKTLLKNLSFSIYYDKDTEQVVRAEFEGIGPDNGRITLNLGPVTITPEQLSPKRWTRKAAPATGGDDR